MNEAPINQVLLIIRIASADGKKGAKAETVFKERNGKDKDMKAKGERKVVRTVSAFVKLLALTIIMALWSASVSAIVIDLDTPGEGPVTTDSGVIWSQTRLQPTGTGYIKPFLRVEASSSSKSEITEGYNTSDAHGNVPMDDKPAPWTHDVYFSDVGNIGGYFVFLLDANQIGDNSQGGAKLTLSEFEIFVSGSPADASYTSQADLQTAFTSVYNMQDDTLGTVDVSGVDLAVQQTSGFPANHGSGSGDLLVYVPVSLIQGDTYLILYTEYGDGNYVNDDGFEEWAYLSYNPNGDIPGIPDASSTVMLLGLAMMGVEALRRKLA